MTFWLRVEIPQDEPELEPEIEDDDAELILEKVFCVKFFFVDGQKFLFDTNKKKKKFNRSRKKWWQILTRRTRM